RLIGLQIPGFTKVQQTGLNGFRACLGQLASADICSLLKLSCLTDIVDQPPLKSILHVEVPAGQTQLQGTTRTERMLDCTKNKERPQSNPDLGQPKCRPMSCNHAMALRGQSEAASKGCSADTDHNRLDGIRTHRKQAFV